MRGTRLATALCGLMLGAHVSLAAETIEADVRPQTPMAERTVYGESFNFDIAISNPKTVPLYIGSIEISYLDAGNEELYARTLDYQGRGLDTIPEPTIAPKSDRLIYNPFPIVPPDIEPQQVRVRVMLFDPPKSRGVTLTPVLIEESIVELSRPDVSQMAFPLKGRIWVWDGHDLTSHHRRFDYLDPGLRNFFTTNSDRYSYDFVMVDAENRMATKDDDKNESYLCYKASVYAPGDGVVVEAHGAEPDNRIFNLEQAKLNQNNLFGNYIIIDHGNGLFSLLGHLHEGSVRVKEGDRVVTGQKIAEVGASGSSIFPHLHYQLMNGRQSGNAEGVPSYFRGILRLYGSKKVPIASRSVDSGDILLAE